MSVLCCDQSLCCVHHDQFLLWLSGTFCSIWWVFSLHTWTIDVDEKLNVCKKACYCMHRFCRCTCVTGIHPKNGKFKDWEWKNENMLSKCQSVKVSLLRGLDRHRTIYPASISKSSIKINDLLIQVEGVIFQCCASRFKWMKWCVFDVWGWKRLMG